MENKIDRTDFIDVYVINTLNEIKKEVKNNIKLNKEREEEIDRKMSLVLKDLINSNFKNLQQDPKGNIFYTLLPIVDEKENKKVRLSLVLYYTALYYDNVDLLHELLKEDVRFETDWYINLQYLDSTISLKFDKDKYVEMINNCGYMFRNFVKSIEILPQEVREKYINRFVKLINLKYDLICSELNKDVWYRNNSYLEHIFEKENLDTFTDETYTSAKIEQLKMINSCYKKRYSKETCDRLNTLMLTKGYSNYLVDFDLMMELYTDEELEKLEYDISYAISNFSETEDGLNKIIDFIQRRPDLAGKIACISKERFMKINNYVLIEALEHVEKHCLLLNGHNIELLSKTMIPKATLKRVLGGYRKKNYNVK